MTYWRPFLGNSLKEPRLKREAPLSSYQTAITPFLAIIQPQVATNSLERGKRRQLIEIF